MHSESEEGRAAAAAELAELEQRLAPELQRLRALRRVVRTQERVPGAPTYAAHLIALLEARKEPATPATLLDALLAAGVVVGGASRKDQQTTIAITLKRGRAFTKVARGLYGLASWDDRAA